MIRAVGATRWMIPATIVPCPKVRGTCRVSRMLAVDWSRMDADILDTRQVPRTFGHGTMVAGIIHLVAPTAQIMPLKAFETDGRAHLFEILRAIYYAVDHGAKVINMSFSTEQRSAEMKRAINYAVR